MFITEITVIKNNKYTDIYALTDEVWDYNEYLYQEYLSEGYELIAAHCECLIGNPDYDVDFLKFLNKQPYKMYVEIR